jgi:1,2-diacylglycerol 3-alpha-glucosyltransferase
LRIAIFSNNYLPRVSGVAVAVDFLDQALRREGHKTFMVAPSYGSDSAVPTPDVHRVPSLPLPKGAQGHAIALPALAQKRLRRAVARFRPQVIHSHHPFLLGDAAADLADELNVPLVYTFHTLYEFFTHYVKLDYPVVTRRVQEFVRSYTDRCDLVIAPTEPIRLYLEELGVGAATATVPTGIDLSRFERVGGEEVDALRREIGLPEREIVLLNVGRISAEKRVGMCVETLAELVRRGRDASLVLFGAGPQEGEVLALAERLGVADRVVHGGFLDQARLPAAYRLGSTFLFPSSSDTQGIVLYEAWASGLPIVTVDSMAARAMLEPGKNGLFAEPEAGAFADAVERLVADPAIGRAPFPHESYSFDAAGGAYTALYRDLAARGRRPVREKRQPFKRLLEDLLGAGVAEEAVDRAPIPPP